LTVAIVLVDAFCQTFGRLLKVIAARNSWTKIAWPLVVETWA
jgi:hypothetical protein